MSYTALYRQYRPKNFDEIIGQRHIVQTLKNQIKEGRISHAYLFTGTRGVGKTSAARILAKAINCLNPSGGNPCGSCEICKDQNNVDIIELDGASNNGVDQAREIREKALYLPASSKKKVYIIDEVHMLTGSAFNALLKTLEEPPEHVVFILCTTESHKIPATILSRCMRFDFALIPLEDLCNLLVKIFKENEIKYTQEGVKAIAHAGEGSVRDALSLADRLAALGVPINYELVSEVLGSTSQEIILKLVSSVLKGDNGSIITIIDKLTEQGKSTLLLTKEISRTLRDMAVIMSTNNAKNLLMMPEEIYKDLSDLANSTHKERILGALEVMTELEVRLMTALSPRLMLEATLLKLAMGSGKNDTSSLEMRISRLEKVINQLSEDKQNPDSKNVKASSTPLASAKQDKAKARTVWVQLLELMRNEGHFALSALLPQIGTFYIEQDVFVIHCSANQYTALTKKENIDILSDFFIKHGLKLRLEESKEETDRIAKLREIAGDVDIKQ